MIRVTFGECKYINYSNKVMEFNDFYDYFHFMDNSSIAYTLKQATIKIEKQVKDLTLEECKKLGLYGVEFAINGIV